MTRLSALPSRISSTQRRKLGSAAFVSASVIWVQSRSRSPSALVASSFSAAGPVAAGSAAPDSGETIFNRGESGAEVLAVGAEADVRAGDAAAPETAAEPAAGQGAAAVGLATEAAKAGDRANAQ